MLDRIWVLPARRRYAADYRDAPDRTNIRVATIIACVMLPGCNAAVQVAAGKLTEAALSSVGLQLPDSSATRSMKTVRLRLEGTRDLNAGDDGQGLATVIRVYKLRDQNSFLATPYASFGESDKEKLAIGQDLVEAKELTLSPGQTFELKEKIPSDAPYLGVVALLRAPYGQRWRFAFPVSEAEREGVNIGVHACAMTATGTAPVGISASDAALLSTAKCR